MRGHMWQRGVTRQRITTTREPIMRVVVVSSNPAPADFLSGNT